MNILVACDSFKGCLKSSEINTIIKETILKSNPTYHIQTFSIGDGGEGTMESIMYHLNGKRITLTVHNPLMELIETEYCIIKDTIAVMEMASSSGLPLIPPESRNPLKTTTYGLGEMIKDAVLNHHIKSIIVGIGGSATNDGGCGMLQALGFKFLDKERIELKYGGEILNRIEFIDSSNVLPQLHHVSFTIACDVNNPLFGKNGAAHVYARQKGATDEMIEELDLGLFHYSEIIKKNIGKDVSSIPGAGAAGGLGAGFLAFLNSQLQSGIDLLLELIGFEESLKNTHLLITGEGKIDHQSFMGKVLDGLIKRALQHNVKVIGIAGIVDYQSLPNSIRLNKNISLFSIQNKPISLEEAMDKDITQKNIEYLIEMISKMI